MSLLSTHADDNRPVLDSFVIASSVYDTQDITDGKVRAVASEGEFFIASGCSRSQTYNAKIVPVMFLDGGRVAIPLQEDLKENSALKENLFIGVEAINHTQQIIPYSGNHMQRAITLKELEEVTKRRKSSRRSVVEKRRCEDEDDFNSKRSRAAEQQLEDVISKICLDFRKNRFESMDQTTLRMNPHSLITLAKASGIGNCFEMACVGYEYVRGAFPDKKVELVQIVNGDHLFLVIGSEDFKTSDRGSGAVDAVVTFINRWVFKKDQTVELDYTSWKSDVVVCDPWSGSCYPASKIKQYLMDYYGVERPLGRAIPCVTPFDPERQSLAFFEVNNV
ncbi:MAG: hypothetical protein WCG10_08425 [Chlamydiota bacterium]